eukprot:scaffold55159_cov58-Cyclotella_meneghiniana.AAC.6
MNKPGRAFPVLTRMGNRYTDEGAPFLVDFLDIQKYPVGDLFWELNTVKFQRWNAAGFLENNDINVTASYLEVDLSQDKSVHTHASPRFWKFLFSSNSERTIELVDNYDCTRYSATTCVRIAFKHFEMQMFRLTWIPPMVLWQARKRLSLTK